MSIARNKLYPPRFCSSGETLRLSRSRRDHALAAFFVIFVLGLTLSGTPPARAQQQSHYWQVTYSNNGTCYEDDSINNAPAVNHPGTWTAGASSNHCGGMYSVDAGTQGTVTATATWVPTTGKTVQQDPPPSQVVVEEQASAFASGPTGVNTEDDGLGGTNNTLWVEKDGSTGVITIADSLVAKTNTATGPPYLGTGSSVTVSFTIVASPVTVSLTGPTADTNNNGALNILIGQNCTASVVGIPAGLTNPAPTYQWSVPGTKFQSWVVSYTAPNPPTAGSSTAVLTAGGGPLTNPTASWYWSDGTGDTNPEPVSCTVTVTPPAGQGAQFTALPSQAVNLQAPLYSDLVTAGTVQISEKAAGQPYWLWAGPSNGPGRGITWTGYVTTPPLFATGGVGTWDFVQTLSGFRFSRTATVGTPQYNPVAGAGSGLDTAYPYPTGVPDYTADGTTQNTGDSPGTTLEDAFTSCTADGSFFTYMMYNPPASGNGAVQWVPIAEVNWSYQASDSIAANTSWAQWTPTPPATNAGTLTAPTQGTRQTVHPTWTQLFTAELWPN